ncbi:MAG: SpoIIE family protein phosphatase [Akkermansiaceae bacterium]|nr:SpoIIE family protein phosphatase [Akkermansiaceae bacterium]
MDDESQDRLELALQASNEGVWDWYVGEEDIYYSARLLRLLGYDELSAPNVIARSAEYLHDEDIEDFQNSLRDALSPDAADNLAADCRYRHPDGQWHWFRIRGVVVRDEEGRALRVVGSFIDISRRKMAEISLEEERYRLRELIDNVPVNVYYKDKESKFVMANTSIAKRFGEETGEDLVGKTDHDFFGKAHADTARADEINIMETRKPQINVIQRENWEGKDDTWVEITKLPWLDRHGNLLGTFGVTSDISNLVRTQRLLTNAAEQLRQRNIAFEEELQLAREIQQALLPQSVEGLILRAHDREVSFACRYTPASEMAGDFYEVMPISQDCIGILVCDVMGHGVRASLIVSMLRGLIEKERDSATSPEWFLYGINDGLVSILERADVTLFATAVYCVVDLKKGTLSYSCAGHPAPIVTRLNKTHQLAHSDGKKNPALGLMPKSTYTTRSISLNDIDRMVIFTDGLHEVENNDSQQLGIDNIIEKIQETSPQKIDKSLDSLIDYARKHSVGGDFNDDVCLFAMDVGSGL